MSKIIRALGALLLMTSLHASAQNAAPGLVGNWKYLRNFTFVHLDAQDRMFQCRVMPDLNVFVATGQLAEAGAVQWNPVRFFSLYGQEVSPSGQDWGANTIELRNLVMWLTVPSAYGQSTERMEFDKVPQLPTICAHYLQALMP